MLIGPHAPRPHASQTVQALSWGIRRNPTHKPCPLHRKPSPIIARCFSARVPPDVSTLTPKKQPATSVFNPRQPTLLLSTYFVRGGIPNARFRLAFLWASPPEHAHASRGGGLPKKAIYWKMLHWKLEKLVLRRYSAFVLVLSWSCP